MKRNKEIESDGSSRSSSSSGNNICHNEITATKGAEGVGISNVGNSAVQIKRGSEGTKGFNERGNSYNISYNKISADDGAKETGIHNVSNTTYVMPSTTEKDR
ncbi:unnamed protein product [Prunus armeniaca]